MEEEGIQKLFQLLIINNELFMLFKECRNGNFEDWVENTNPCDSELVSKTAFAYKHKKTSLHYFLVTGGCKFYLLQNYTNHLNYKQNVLEQKLLHHSTFVKPTESKTILQPHIIKLLCFII